MAMPPDSKFVQKLPHNLRKVSIKLYLTSFSNKPTILNCSKNDLEKKPQNKTQTFWQLQLQKESVMKFPTQKSIESWSTGKSKSILFQKSKCWDLERIKESKLQWIWMVLKTNLRSIKSSDRTSTNFQRCTLHWMCSEQKVVPLANWKACKKFAHN